MKDKKYIFVFSILIVTMLLQALSVYAESAEDHHLTMSFSYENMEVYAIKENDSLWACPIDEFTGEYGEFKKIMDGVVSVSGNYAIKEDGSLWTWGRNLFTNEIEECPIKVMEDVKEVSEVVTYESFLLIIKNDNSLWGIGSNYYGQLAQGEINEEAQLPWGPFYVPDNISEPVKIMDGVEMAQAGSSHSIVLKQDGSVWIFGGGYGMGMDPTETTNVPVKIMDNAKNVSAGACSSFVITDEAESTSWRWGIMCPELAGVSGNWPRIPVQYVKNTKKVLSCSGYTILLKNDNTLWTYGQGEESKENIKEDGVFLKEPIEITDNIDNITNYSGSIDEILVLNKQGELYTLSFDCFASEYTLTKLLDGVRLSDEALGIHQKLVVSVSGMEMNIFLNDELVTFPDAQPFVDENNRTQIPIRALGEMLGFTVGWDGDTLTASVSDENNIITIKIGENTLIKNGAPIEMDTSAVVINDRTYIPLRFVGEAFGYDVEWSQN